MNTKFLNKYSVVIDGEHKGLIWYLAPLGDKQRYREKRRIALENNYTSYKDARLVSLLRTYG